MKVLDWQVLDRGGPSHVQKLEHSLNVQNKWDKQSLCTIQIINMNIDLQNLLHGLCFFVKSGLVPVLSQVIEKLWLCVVI